MPEWSVREVVKTIEGVTKSKGDFIIAVSGNAGIGKSTLVNQIVKEKTGERFSAAFFEKYNFYSREELDKKLEELPNNSIFILDESINMMFKREWQNREQIKIIQKLNTYRNKGFIIFLLLPRFTDIDSAVRNSSRIKWWINCLSWGEAVIYQADDNEFNPDPWNLKINMKLLLRGRKRYNLPNYVANLYWQEMEKEAFELYEEIKGKKRKEAYKLDKEKSMTKRDVIKEILKINPDTPINSLAESLGTPKRYVYEILAELGGNSEE